MKVHGLLLDRHVGGDERRHDGRIAVDERNRRWWAKEPNGALMLAQDVFMVSQRSLIARLTAAHRLPAVYPLREYVTSGGLLSYGADTADRYGRAASYVDRILRGEKPADLPVQAPIKFELVVNLNTAKSLGLKVPPMLLARADEVIE
jgi:putative ABC transport system substrate-binding protein